MFKRLEDVSVYMDVFIINDDIWKENFKSLKSALFQVMQVDVTMNSSISDVVKAKVVYLGNVVGHAVEAKV